MGRAKAYMMEMQDLEDNGALVEFTCPNKGCAEEISEYVIAPIARITAEKQSDICQSEVSEVSCDECGTSYEVIVSNDSAMMDAQLELHPKVSVHVEPPNWFCDHGYEDDDWFYEISDGPRSFYKEACSELDKFVSEQCVEDGASLKNRMALMQAWSIFETYLADQLATHLTDNRDALIRFSRSDGAIKNLQFDAVNMLEHELTVQDEIIRAIKSRLYHKFGKKGLECSKSDGVPKWFRIGLQLEIEPDVSKLDKLRFFATLRHDCVHRNGRDRNGEVRNEILKSKIVEMRKLMDGIVSHINLTLPKQEVAIEF